MDTVAFNSIGFHAALILNRLRSQAQLTSSDKEQDENRERDTARKRANKDDSKDQRDYVERRLRELAEWERRLNKGRG
jgi:hypothetical protein